MKSIKLTFLLFLSLIYILSCKTITKKESKPLEPPSDYYPWDKLPYPNEKNLKTEHELLSKVKSQLNQRSPQDFFNKKWKLEGPTNIGGRVSAFALDPSNNNIMYVGYSNGGIFKSADNAQSWNPIFDQELTLSIGAIAIDPKNPEIIYVGTGDPDINGNSYVGNGLYKSVNGGQTWNNNALKQVRVINEIIIDPINSNIIYLGAMGNPFEPSSDRGVYKSLDAGNTWTKQLFVSDSAGITDIAMNPKNNNILYACSFHRIRTAHYSIVEGPDSKIFKSIDAGKTWKLIMQGITNTSFSRIAIDISTTDPNTLYVRTVKFIADCRGYLEYNMEGLYKSINGGDSWNKINVDYSTLACDFLGGFGWYFGKIVIDPFDDHHIFLPGVRLWESFDGGIIWHNLDDVNGAGIHSDLHTLVFDKNNNIILGSDGGLFRYNQNSNSWSDIENIPTTQFYRITLNPNEPLTYYGGAQDNGTLKGNYLSINNWDRVYYGDGFQAGFHSLYPDFAWFEYQYGNLNFVNTRTGDQYSFRDGITGTSNWDTPFFLSNHNEDTMYFGSDKVLLNAVPTIPDWKEVSPVLTLNGSFPNSITPTITCMAESQIIPNNLIVGTTNGNVWLGNSISKLWKKLIGLPSGYITNVESSSLDLNTYYVSFSNYRDNNNTSYLFKTTDNGKIWTSITSTELNEIPILDFTFVPHTNENVILAGTLYGVYATIDGGINWRRVGTNMPIIPVNSILYDEKGKKIIAGTFARSIQSYEVDEFTSTEEIDQISVTLSPIPTNENLRIQLSNDMLGQHISLKIFDLNGKLQNKNSFIYSSIQNIDVGMLVSGTYYLNIESKKKSKCIAFIKL
ncbi:MAG: T9SS type A sorting domain-containing protein [Saprospiraceae bacterium]